MGRDANHYLAKIQNEDVLQGRCEHSVRYWLWQANGRR